MEICTWTDTDPTLPRWARPYSMTVQLAENATKSCVTLVRGASTAYRVHLLLLLLPTFAHQTMHLLAMTVVGATRLVCTLTWLSQHGKRSVCTKAVLFQWYTKGIIPRSHSSRFCTLTCTQLVTELILFRCGNIFILAELVFVVRNVGSRARSEEECGSQ